MRRLPELKITPVPSWQTERLSRWLQEWRISRALLSAEHEPCEDAGAVAPEGAVAGRAIAADADPAGGVEMVYNRLAEMPVDGESAARDAVPRAGQIRLLRPSIPAAFGRPVYLAILKAPKARGVLAAPYGRFAEPAVPGELLTGRASPALRVLCVWNSLELSRELLGQSWAVGRMSGAERRDGLAVLGYLRSGGAPADSIAPRLGPPLVHPADPRHAYLEEEAEWAGCILSGESIGTPHGDAAYDVPDRFREDLPMAADPRDDYGNRKQP